MAKDFKLILSEDVGLPENVQNQLLEALNSKLEESKKQIEESLREEYAARFEHDKNQIVESIDKFVTSKLTAELEEFSKDKVALAEERMNLRKQAKENIEKFGNFIKESLTKEVSEFRHDRKIYESKIEAMEHFVSKKLYEEISEFAQDKKQVLEEKVRIVTEGRKQIQDAKRLFIENAARVVSAKVDSKLKQELTVLKEDIQLAKKHEFGRKIFEAFASEYMVSHLNESKEIAALKSALTESKTVVNKIKDAALAKDRENKALKRHLQESKLNTQRMTILNDLLAPLSADKKSAMNSLLENVAVDNLKSMFNKYLPVVLSNKHTSAAKILSESKLTEFTGNRASHALQGNDANVNNEIVELQKLAGLKR
jgi:hypothetical protein